MATGEYKRDNVRQPTQLTPFTEFSGRLWKDLGFKRRGIVVVVKLCELVWPCRMSVILQKRTQLARVPSLASSHHDIKPGRSQTKAFKQKEQGPRGFV